MHVSKQEKDVRLREKTESKSESKLMAGKVNVTASMLVCTQFIFSSEQTCTLYTHKHTLHIAHKQIQTSSSPDRKVSHLPCAASVPFSSPFSI